MLRKILRFTTQPQTLQKMGIHQFSSAKQVRVIKSHSNSIFWNLATEEYLFESPDLNTPTLFLYREDKTIIIGKVSY